MAIGPEGKPAILVGRRLLHLVQAHGHASRWIDAAEHAKLSIRDHGLVDDDLRHRGSAHQEDDESTTQTRQHDGLPLDARPTRRSIVSEREVNASIFEILD
jgi:hypothetical protein